MCVRMIQAASDVVHQRVLRVEGPLALGQLLDRDFRKNAQFRPFYAIPNVGEQRLLLGATRRRMVQTGLSICREKRPLQCIEDVRHGELRGLTAQHVPALSPALTCHHSGFFHRMKHLLEEPGRNRLSLGDRLGANRLFGMVERKIYGGNAARLLGLPWR